MGWMFVDWPERTFLRDRQVLMTALSRLVAIVRRLLKRNQTRVHVPPAEVTD